MDYNNWATQYGLTNMSWPNVLNYFLLSENNTDPVIRANGLHSNMGPIEISTETEPDPVLLSFRTSFNLANHPIGDINGPQQMDITNIAQMYWNSETGRKSTTANEYIESANQTNLIISARSFVTCLLYGNGGSRVSGVTYRNKQGNTMVAFARQEVIISAGTINTPQVRGQPEAIL